METLEKLCMELNMPDGMTAMILKADAAIDYEKIADPMDMLFSRSTWDTGRQNIKAALGSDTHGAGMLACMLRCALKTRQTYRERGIPDEIFIDTMKCFSRFTGESKASFGTYSFDRDFWTPRVLALEEFRIGQLEYEMHTMKGSRVISIHIPSDAVLDKPLLNESYRHARRFFAAQFPDYDSVPMVCDSWLLSPALRHLLPENSRILAFQSEFILDEIDTETNDGIQWVFGRKKMPVENLPENTSLQRSMKRFLLNGGRLGEARGHLKEPAFI